MDIILPLLLQLVLIVLNAIFACAEIAIVSTNEAKLNKLISEGNKNAKILQKLKNNPSNFLSTIQITITLSGFLGSAFAAENFSGVLVDLLSKTGVVTQQNAEIFDNIAVVVITLILSYFTLVFGELIPKRVGMRKAEKIALVLARPISFISYLFKPIVWLLTISINSILKLIGIDPYASDGDEGEENIRMMVDMSSEKGLIDKIEQEMIQNVFEFDDLTVGEFAVHRKNVEILWYDDDILEWDKMIKETFHNYYPICGENADDVIGVLNTKDYFKIANDTKEKVLKNSVKPAYFVPETLKADILFKQMKETNNKFAIVLDEQGGVEGIVTMNDLLEQIVGDFDDECETNEKIGENEWIVSGTLTIEEANELFGTKFSEEDYSTMNGLVFDKYGNVPADNTKFEIEIENLKISVQELKDHIITKMKIKKVISDENIIEKEAT